MGKRLASMVTPAGADPVTRASMLLMEATNTLLKYADVRFYGACRLSLSKYVALLVLAANGGVMRSTRLAEWTATKRSNISTLENP